MLAQLRIRDFAVIEQVDLELKPGLNVLTGETGAGKSIIVEAAGLLRGGRSSSAMVRRGAKEAVVEALFDLERCPQINRILGDKGIPAGDDLLVRRIISAGGRGRIYVNGSLCSAAILADISRSLFDISGQNEHQTLSDRTVQRDILDKIALTAEVRRDIASIVNEIEQLIASRNRLELSDSERGERIDFLRFQLNEIESAQLNADEEEKLEDTRRRLQRATDLKCVAERGESILYSNDDALIGTLGQLQRDLEGLTTVDERIARFVSQLQESRIQLEDLAESLRHYGDGIDLDSAALDEIDQRMDVIFRLKRKHGGTVNEILARAEKMRTDLTELEHAEGRIAEIERHASAVRAKAQALAKGITRDRCRAANDLADTTSMYLKRLKMGKGSFVATVEPRQAREDSDPWLCFDEKMLTTAGWDRVEFRFSANAGEEPKPINQVASGGELSRLMLALRQVLGRHDPVNTSIYDEIDAGIGGAVADIVGQLLASIAQQRQVLCVTHLPQIAAYANAHFVVGKTEHQGRTVSALRSLSEKEQIEELARMLAARKVTAQARANAKSLMNAARQNLGNAF